jgi:hypothetical protein
VEEIKSLDLYTFFPYEPGNCGTVSDITIVDKWLLEDNGTFERNANLFPSKVPDDFMGCPVKVSALGFRPFIIVYNNQSQEDGSISYNVSGTFIEYFLIPFTKMNLSVTFLNADMHPTPKSFLKMLSDLVERSSDIAIGFVPVFPLVALPGVVYTVPHTCAVFSLFVPCPARVYKTSKLFSTFTLPVWLTLALAFLLTSTAFWLLENKSYLTSSRELPSVSAISTSVYNAWAILMAISVPKMPSTWPHRTLFLVYVTFCFAMVTVFQTFFVSYLVEPGYGKAITTVEEAIHSDLLLSYTPLLDTFIDTMDYDVYSIKVPESRKRLCLNTVECTKRLITDRDVAVITTPFHMTYAAKSMGISGSNKVVCHVDQSFSIYIAALVPKTSPFLDGINDILRRSIESGVLTMLRARIHLRADLQGMHSHEVFQESAATFFVFQVRHLTAAFTILLLGHCISCGVFVLEMVHKRLSEHGRQSRDVRSLKTQTTIPS